MSAKRPTVADLVREIADLRARMAAKPKSPTASESVHIGKSGLPDGRDNICTLNPLCVARTKSPTRAGIHGPDGHTERIA